MPDVMNTFYLEQSNVNQLGDFIIEIIKEGWNTPVNELYFNYVNKTLLLNIKFDEVKSCYDLLNIINKLLKQKILNNFETSDTKCVINSQSDIDINKKYPNINREAYNCLLEQQVPTIENIIKTEINFTSQPINMNYQEFSSIFQGEGKGKLLRRYDNKDNEDLTDLYHYTIDKNIINQPQKGGSNIKQKYYRLKKYDK